MEMGHRHIFSSSQIFESEHDLNWNHMQTEPSYGHIAMTGGTDNDLYFYPIENMFSDGINFSPHWSPFPRSNGYTSSTHNTDVPPYPTDVPGPSHIPFQQHSISPRTFSTVAENYPDHGSSSRQTFQGSAEAGLVDLAVGNGLRIHKRKSPGVPSVSEQGSTSRYFGAGSSSEPQNEKTSLNAQHVPPDRVGVNNPGFNGGNAVSIEAEGSMRNVRSRSMHDMQSSGNPTNDAYSTNVMDHPVLMDICEQPSSGFTLACNHFSRIAHERSLASGSNSNTEGFQYSTVPPPSYPGTSSQSTRGVRSSSYSQRPNLTSRASSSSSAGLRLGHLTAPPEEGGLQLVAESHARNHRPLSNSGWRNAERNSRSRVSSNERHRSPSDEAGFHDQGSSEGFRIAVRSSGHGLRNSHDQHREMRLDVDNMSYEELLALGERIGSVSTGVSADLMSKCVIETIYCSSDQMQDEEGSCVICLEEYKNMDDVGTLKTCGHDYHVECIKKWLEMKNLCPICKGPALADHMKKEK